MPVKKSLLVSNSVLDLLLKFVNGICQADLPVCKFKSKVNLLNNLDVPVISMLKTGKLVTIYSIQPTVSLLYTRLPKSIFMSPNKIWGII